MDTGDLFRMLDRHMAEAAIADADKPHVLVSVVYGGPIKPDVGAVVGPFPDLWEALAYAPVWMAELHPEPQDPNDHVQTLITAAPLTPKEDT